MKKLRLSVGVLGATLLLVSGSAHAQLAPTPQKAPRTPVSKELIAGRAAALPPSHVVTGPATVIDSERLRINDVELRLFGVVPPQLGASFGPQARAVVDALAQGTVSCQVKDRTREGHYLALCRNESNADFGIELLRRGLAVAARGSLRTSEYGTPYLAAEQAAQNQRLGLWSTSLPTAASEKSIREAALKAEALRNETEQAKAELAKAEAIKAEAVKAAEIAKAQADAAVAALPATAVRLSTSESLPVPAIPQAKTETVKALASGIDHDDVQSMLSASQSFDMPKLADDRSFFEKYQMLLSGLLLFMATLVALFGSIIYKRIQRKDDLKSTAAALRGELMAARSICQARLSKIAHDRTDKDTTWPRIRTTVFQAYVGKLGCLGADLSRQIASIYGMASDYASYYNTTDARAEGSSKRQALEALVQHIEEVSPKLGIIETTGELPKTPKPVSFRSVLPAPVKPLPLSSSSTPPTDGPSGTPVPPPEKAAQPPTPTRTKPSVTMSEAKTEIVSETRKGKTTLASDFNTSDKEEELRAARAKAAQAKPQATAKPATKKPVQQTATNPAAAAKTTMSAATKVALKADNAAQAAIKAVSNINFKAPIMEKLAKIKTFTANQFDADKTIPEKLDDFTIPDYANLTEEELEALLYAEEELILASPAGKTYQAG